LIAAHRAESKKLDTLISIERTNIHGSIPTVTDVPRIRLKRGKVYTFCRSEAISTINAPTTAPDLLGALYFSLSSLTGSTEFTTLFDQYRIIQVTVKFIPLAGAGSGSNPLVTAFDYDDASAPTGVVDLFQYDSVQLTQPGVVLERTMTPRVVQTVYQGVPSAYATAPNSLWIDASYPSVQYYGLKYGVAANSGSSANWNVLAEYILQCRNSR